MIKEPNQPSSPWILVTNTIEADFFSHAIAQVGVPDSCIIFLPCANPRTHMPPILWFIYSLGTPYLCTKLAEAKLVIKNTYLQKQSF